MATREEQLENIGLVGKGEPPAPAPVTEPSGGAEPAKTPPPSAAPPRAPWAKPKVDVAPPKPAPEPVKLAGKFGSAKDLAQGIKELSKKLSKDPEIFTDVKEAEQYYLGLEKEFHATPPAQRTAPPPSPPPKPPAPAVEPKPEEPPDPLLDPEGYRNYVVRQAVQAVEQQRQGQEQADALRAEWKAKNPDIEQLLPDVERAVATDPRTVQAKNVEELWSIINEHTDHYRQLAGRFMDLGRNEERTKLAGVSPTAPNVTQEQPSTPPGEGTTAEPTEDVDEYIKAREQFLTERRGYGFARDDMSRSMNQR